MKQSIVLFLLFAVGLVSCELKVYNFTLSWLWAAPDGFYRPVIHINNLFPGPLINITRGDEVIVNVKNELFSESTSIHWHGLFFYGFNDQDGSPMVTQDFIPPYSEYQYRWKVNWEQYGTYWYHSHNFYQTGDGLHGPLIIYKPGDANKYQYDKEVVVMINDWGHSTSTTLMTGRQFVGFPQYYNYPQLNMLGPLINGVGYFNCSGREAPVIIDATHKFVCDNSKLVTPTFDFTPGMRYRFRIINSGIRNNLNFTIDGHKLKIVEAQGTPVVAYEVDSIQLLVSQRLDVIVTANQAVGNYWMRVGIDRAYATAELAGEGRHYGNTTLGIVRYAGAPIQNPTSSPNANTVKLDKYDQLTSAPGVPKPKTRADKFFWFNITFGDPSCGAAWPRGYGNVNPAGSPNCIGPTFAINGVPMFIGGKDNLYHRVISGDKHPTIRSGSLADVDYKDVVDVVIQAPPGNGGLDHVMHIHGHKVWVLGWGYGLFNGTYTPNLENPAFLDSFTFTSNRWYLMRFYADNPGLWMLHCHMDGHNFDGVMMVFNVAPNRVNNWSHPQQGWDTLRKNEDSSDDDGDDDDDDDKRRKRKRRVF